jgi:hypothetical protein
MIQVILQEDSLKEGTYRLQPWSLKGSWSTRASRSRSSSRRPFHGLPGLPRASGDLDVVTMRGNWRMRLSSNVSYLLHTRALISLNHEIPYSLGVVSFPSVWPSPLHGGAYPAASPDCQVQHGDRFLAYGPRNHQSHDPRYLSLGPTSNECRTSRSEGNTGLGSRCAATIILGGSPFRISNHRRAT